MELKHYSLIVTGIFVIILLIAFLLFNINKGRKSYGSGKRIVNNFNLDDDPYFKKKLVKYKIYTFALIAAFILSIAVCFFMLARPYKTQSHSEKLYNRDILLCIDISTSVDALNMNLVDELKDTVSQLDGERFGIVIFNTSPVTVIPLTNDYEYIVEQLDLIKESLKSRISYNDGYDYDDIVEYLYMDQYISSGTLVGNAERGSSLIGDGLASAAYEFSDENNERTKIIIFTSDNDLQGTPLFTLEEAAKVCKENDITVFGVGTKEMYEENMEEMKSAVESTGGKFFLEESSGTFDQIVTEIEKLSKSLLSEKTEIKEIEIVETPFVILLLLVSTMILLVKITKR